MPNHVPGYHTDHYGYERWRHMIDYEQNYVAVHRLLAVAELGFDAVTSDIDVHHSNGIPWDNRPGNIELVPKGDHAALHSTGRDNYEDKDTPYRDKKVLRELYVGRGMSTYEVADELDTSRATVSRWLDKHEIDTRGPPGK
jgi:hypothetical protein